MMIDYEYGIGDEFDEEAEEAKESKEFYDWGEGESFLHDDYISNDWNYGTDYNDF